MDDIEKNTGEAIFEEYLLTLTHTKVVGFKMPYVVDEDSIEYIPVKFYDPIKTKIVVSEGFDNPQQLYRIVMMLAEKIARAVSGEKVVE